MRRLLICDDEPARLRDWHERLSALDVVRENFDLSELEKGELTREIEELERRRLQARDGEQPEKRDSRIDEADLLIVDYDLAELDPTVYQTGEGIAYLARCFSSCGYIVGLNQFGENPFDLTLRGHPESYADLNIGGLQLDNAGLWTTQFPSLRPWSWPLIPQAVELLQRRALEIETHLEETIFGFFGVSGQRLAALPRSLQQFIARGVDPETATFRSFVFDSESGLRGRESSGPLDDASVARVAASRIATWLEQMVLPGQDILVDAAHLALRFPSLLANDGAWEATVESVAGSRSGLQDDVIAEHRFEPTDWLSRHAWWWQSLANDESVSEVREPWEATPPELVFAEDTCRFVPPDQAQEFVAELSTPFVRRYVEGPDDDPIRRDVTYEPAVFFAL
jgi:hypothetical protein